MPSREEVIYAYRLLLGREPESETVINHYATELKDLKSLRELFMNSPEFRDQLSSQTMPRAPRPPFSGPRMEVQLDLTAEQLAALFARTQAQWEHLGATEPHWSVITNENYRQERYAGNEASFYASGESECQLFESTLRRAGLELNAAATCVEFGCGVGRVTAGLARRFARVIGVDISASHLRYAEQYARNEGLHSMQLRHLARLEDVPALGSYDVLYSRIVLQHNPPPVQAWLLRQLLGQLRSGGIGFFQIPVYKPGYRFRLQDYLQLPNETDMEMHYLPQQALLEAIEAAGCKVLELREDDAIGLSATAISNTVLVRRA